MQKACQCRGTPMAGSLCQVPPVSGIKANNRLLYNKPHSVSLFRLSLMVNRTGTEYFQPAIVCCYFPSDLSIFVIQRFFCSIFG